MYCFMKEEQCEGGAPSVVRRLHAYLDFAGQLLNPSPQSAAVDRSWIHGSLNFCLNHSTCGPSKVPTACLTEYSTVQYMCQHSCMCAPVHVPRGLGTWVKHYTQRPLSRDRDQFEPAGYCTSVDTPLGTKNLLQRSRSPCQNTVFQPRQSSYIIRVI